MCFFFAARTRVWKQRGSDHKLAVPAPLTPPTLAQHPSFTHVRRLLAKAEEGATRDPDRTGRSRQESGWCVSPYRFKPPAPPFRAPPLPRTGIQLLQAEDLKTWYFSIEVLGESLYQVCLSTLIFNDPSPSIHPIWCSQIFFQNEVFHLMVRFDPEYPFKSPAVQFVVSDKVKPPVHPVRPHRCPRFISC